MASYGFTEKTGRRGAAEPHYRYVTRIGKHKNRASELVGVKVWNLPHWAGSPAEFFRAADTRERKNGAAYSEHVLVLPREQTTAQNWKMVDDWIAAELPDRAVVAAYHCSDAELEKGKNPHAHVMFSNRVHDGIPRDETTYFNRANRKDPIKGGCRTMPSQVPVPIARRNRRTWVRGLQSSRVKTPEL